MTVFASVLFEWHCMYVRTMYLQIQALRGGGAEVAGGRVVGNQVGSHAVTWLAPHAPLWYTECSTVCVYKISVESTS